MLFKKTPVYIKIYVNQVEVTNLLTGESVAASADHAFSTERIIIADFNAIAAHILTLLKEVLEKKVFPPQLKILIQQVEPVAGGLTEIERRALRDLGEQAGGTSVVLVEEFIKLSNEEALLRLSR